MSKDRSRILILNEVLSFPLGGYWKSDFASRGIVQVGDLISINCAPPTKWYLSWVRKIKGEQMLLESIEDGALCWWSNIGVNIYARDRIHENWQWDDKQFAFNDRWFRTCRKIDGYIVRPLASTFGINNAVTLDVRIRYNSSDFRNPKTFDNWKKTTVKMLEAYYRECLELYEKSKEVPKS